MLTFKAIPHLLKIISKIDISVCTEKLKTADISTVNEKSEKEIDREKVGVLAFEIIGELTPQLAKIADDIVPFIAAYKNISIEEAENLEVTTVLGEVFADSGVMSFFRNSLRPKAGPAA